MWRLAIPIPVQRSNFPTHVGAAPTPRRGAGRVVHRFRPDITRVLQGITSTIKEAFPDVSKGNEQILNILKQPVDAPLKVQNFKDLGEACRWMSALGAPILVKCHTDAAFDPQDPLGVALSAMTQRPTAATWGDLVKDNHAMLSLARVFVDKKDRAYRRRGWTPAPEAMGPSTANPPTRRSAFLTPPIFGRTCLRRSAGHCAGSPPSPCSYPFDSLITCPACTWREQVDYPPDLRRLTSEDTDSEADDDADATNHRLHPTAYVSRYQEAELNYHLFQNAINALLRFNGDASAACQYLVNLGRAIPAISPTDLRTFMLAYLRAHQYRSSPSLAKAAYPTSTLNWWTEFCADPNYGEFSNWSHDGHPLPSTLAHVLYEAESMKQCAEAAPLHHAHQRNNKRARAEDAAPPIRHAASPHWVLVGTDALVRIRHPRNEFQVTDLDGVIVEQPKPRQADTLLIHVEGLDQRGLEWKPVDDQDLVEEDGEEGDEEDDEASNP